MDEQLALVTGGARRLGRAFSRHLAARGYALLIHYHRSEAEAEGLAAELRAEGAQVWTQAADLRQEAEIRRLFRRVDALGLPLAVLVNSAAEMREEDLATLDADSWRETLSLNLTAPLLCAQRAAARMSAGGLIVNLSDVGAGKVWTKYPAYVVSKAALETLTRLLARALAPRVRVNAIAPGLVLPSPDLSPERWQALVERTPLRTAVPLQSLTAALDYLLQATAVTGQVLRVDAGYDLI